MKIKVGSALFLDDDNVLTMEINGRDAVSGLPKTIEVNSNDVTSAISVN